MARKTIKQKIQEIENAKAHSRLKTLKMEDLLPQVVNNVIVRIIDGYHTQLFPDNMTGDKYRTFKKSRAGVFTRDSLAFSRNKPHGEYFLYQSDEERYIGRIIKEDELLMFQALHLVDGKIVDANYMKLRDLAQDEKLTCSVRYIKKDESEANEEMEELAYIEEPDPEDDAEAAITSVSLFDE